MGPLPFIDDDGFREAILGAHAVLAPEELQEAEAALKNGGTIAKGAFDGLPEAQAWVREGDSAGAGDPFAGRPPVAEVIEQPEVEEHDDEVAALMEIPNDMEGLFVKDLDAPQDLDRSPEEDGEEEVDGIAEEALAEGGEGATFQGLQAGALMGVKAAWRGTGRDFFHGSGHGWR